MTNLGFVALGILGRPMAGHLAAAGHAVHVYNRTPKTIYLRFGTGSFTASRGACFYPKLLEFKTYLDVKNYFSELCKIQLEYHTIFR